MHRKTNISVRKARTKKIITIIGNVVCLVIASVVFTACDNKHSELYNVVYEAATEIQKNGFFENEYEHDNEVYYELADIHKYYKTQESGHERTFVTINTSFVEYKESKENHLKINYSRIYNASLSGTFNLSKSNFYEIEWYPKYLKFRITDAYTYQDKKDKFSDNNIGEWRTVSLVDKITQADADMHNAVLLMSEYYPILEKEMNINFADYGYVTNFSEILSNIKELLPEEETDQSQTSDEQTDRYYSDREQNDLDYENNNNSAKDDDNSYDYQSGQPEQSDTNNDLDEKEREYEQKQKELSRKNYKDAIVVLNKIESAVNQGDLGCYDEIYALYNQTIEKAEFTNETYNMKTSIWNVLSSYQDYCSESGDDDISMQNREFYTQMIHRQIDEFKEQWRDLSV